MSHNFQGRALLLDRDNINTDEIIPAKYLTYVDRKPLKKHLLEDLKLDGFDLQKTNWKEYNIIISKSNFGCGSSREMAVWVFEENGISMIISSNFARIFRENAINSGILPIELGIENINNIFKSFGNSDFIEVSTDLSSCTLIIQDSNSKLEFSFDLSNYDKKLVKCGGFLNFVIENY